MIYEIPQYGLKAYALFYSKYGIKGSFSQSELDWVVSSSMKKKIFALLLKSGWIKKASRKEYKCVGPEEVFNGLIQFKVLELIKKAERKYALTNLSAVELWSDFSYVQRGIEKSPYFIKVLKKDLRYWKDFFNKWNIPNYISKGSTIGEYIILIPVKKIRFVEREGLKVDSLRDTMKIAEKNDLLDYAYKYMRRKYAAA